MTTNSTPVLRSQRGGVLHLVLNRPHRRNALDGPAWELLFDELRRASTDETVRCLVLQGADHTFCSGADISSVPTGHPLVRIRHINRVASALHDFPKPVVASVEGYAIGAGWNLALCCDLVVAASSASFSEIFVSRGLSPDFGGSWLLPRLAGLQQAKRLALLAERIDAVEAHALGLVTWVVDPDEIEGFTADVADRLAAMPPVAAAQTKHLLNAGVDTTFNQALEAEASAQAINYATEDAPRAIRAFKDGDVVTFTGKWALE